jgi:deoxycytidylate deaminase
MSHGDVPQEVIDLAERLCRKKSGFSRYPMAAIIYGYKRNTPVVISTGVNYHLRICHDKVITGGRNGTPYSRHAERDAILGCSKRDLFGSSIYIHRLGGKLAKPCEKCMNLIMSTGINTISWSQ